MSRPPLSSDTVSHDVRVQVQPYFLPEESEPEEGRYVFAYRITITNEGARSVQLLDRHWIIIDGDGHREDVEGAGVVGYQPTLDPGRSFRYTSYCPLPTEWGTMEGSYGMVNDDGEEFRVRIGRFVLAVNVPQASV